MSDVFISYSRKDSDFVHKLDNTLTAAKRDVWVDWQSIARGEDWWHSIQTGIDSTDTAIIIITEHWLVSEVCHRELEYIRQRNKRVFPIIREKIEGDVAIRTKGTWVDQEWEQRARDNWKYLRSVNWLYFDDDTTFDTAFKDLLTALDTDQVYVKGHTRYLVRATEWQQSKRDPSFLLEGDQLDSAQTWLTSSVGKHPEPLPIHHEYVTASHVAETVRIARDKAREQLIRRFRQAAILLGAAVAVAIIAAAFLAQQFISARAEVTRAGATLQQVNLQITDAINQQITAAAQVDAAVALVATATIEQGNAIEAQQTSSAREQAASTQVAVAGATLSPVPPTLTAVAVAINDANDQQDIALALSDASLQIANKQNDDALQVANQMVADYPDEPLAYLGRGLILDTMGRLDDAVADYTQAIQLNPQYAIAYYDRAVVYNDQGETDKAIADYTHAIQYDPTYIYSYENRGLIYLDTDENDKALADFNKALELDPQSADLYNNRGLVYENQDQLDKAFADYTHALQLNPNSAQAYDGLGHIHYLRGDVAAAVADYTQAIKVNSTFPDAYYSRGLIYASQKKFDEALVDLTQAITLDPQNANIYDGRGLVYTRQNKLDQAIADFTQTINLAPDYVDAYNDRGTAYVKQGDDARALTDFNRAIELNPQYALAYSNRAAVYTRQGKSDQALADYWQWAQLNETKPTTADTLKSGQTPFNTTISLTEGATYRLPFEAKAGQFLQAQATAAQDAAVDPLLILLDPQGKPITYNDDIAPNDSNSAISDYALPADGTYTLLVTYAGGGSEGAVQVTLDLTSTTG